MAIGGSYVLLNVFLTVLEGGLAELGGDLRSGVVHELAVGAKDVAARAPLLLVGVRVVAMLLRLRGARRGRR